MAATKGAVLSLLADAYVRRDRVAVVVFRNRSAEVVLGPTSGALIAQRQLEKLSVGGTTPLTHGLVTAYGLIKTEMLKDDSLRPLFVLVSDGRGNVAMGKEDPAVEARRVAERIRAEKIDALVIDSVRDLSSEEIRELPTHTPMYHQIRPSNACADLAEAMGARYHALYDLSRDGITAAVADELRR